MPEAVEGRRAVEHRQLGDDYNEMLKRRPDLAGRATRPVYRDRRGEVPEGAEEWYAVPVFNPMPDGGLVATYVRSAMRKAQRFPEVPRMTPGARSRLRPARPAAPRAPAIHLDMEFRPGDIQFVNNHWIMHSRTAFEDFPEPENRRHLFRLWLACDDGPAAARGLYRRHWQGATAPGPAGRHPRAGRPHSTPRSMRAGRDSSLSGLL